MIARRQFIQLGASALATALTGVSGALSLPDTQQLTLGIHDQKLPTAIEEVFTREKKIKVVGVGGCGCSVADQMIASGLPKVEYAFADTLWPDQVQQYGWKKYIHLHRHVLKFYGCLRDRLRVTEETVVNGIRSEIEGTDMLIITAGFGSYTGSRAAPIIAHIAKEMGITTVGVVTMAMTSCETTPRLRLAEAGLIEMQANTDSLIALSQDKLLETLGDDVYLDEFFAYSKDQIRAAIRGVIENVDSYTGSHARIHDNFRIPFYAIGETDL
jgi:cell division protein FtsZ